MDVKENIQDESVTMTDTALAEPKQITLKEYKKMMAAFFTKRNNTVAACGHKFYTNGEAPHNNCEYCWFAYFQTHGDVAKTADECFRTDGEATLIKIRGEKFTKMFKRFMATLAKFVAENQNVEVKENDENGNSTTEGQDGVIQEASVSGTTAEQEVRHEE